MARVLFVFVLTVLSYAVAVDPTEHTGKHAIMIRESGLAADALRNITFKNPQCKIRLASMATDFIVGLNNVVYTLNTLIPSVIGDENFELLNSTAQLIADSTSDIQRTISGDFETLKGRLIAVLEAFETAISKFDETFKKDSNRFVNNQINRKAEIVVFALYKIKFQAASFAKSNKELVLEMTDTLDAVTKNVNSLTSINKVIEEELRYILEHLMLVTAKAVSKLENWVEVNPDRIDDVKIVQSVSKTLSELFDIQHRALAGNHDAQYLKNEMLNIYKTGQTKVIELANIDYPDNSGGPEFIRSILFDDITIGRAYAEIVKSLISKH